MPTGYTADIAKGISFEQYAWSCARAFGAMVMMRDEPADAPIPEAFEPSGYQAKALAEAREQLANMRSLTGDALIQTHAEAVRADWEYNASRHREADELRAKYEAMLIQAKNYQPPSRDHLPFAEFMIEQIQQSIDFDCKVYERDPITPDPHLWRAQQIERLEKSVAYHASEHLQELERTAKRNLWLRELRQSLTPAATV